MFAAHPQKWVKNMLQYVFVHREGAKITICKKEAKLGQEMGKCDIIAANKKEKMLAKPEKRPKMPVQQDGKSKCVAKRGDLSDAQIRSKWTENPWMLAVSHEIQKGFKHFGN